LGKNKGQHPDRKHGQKTTGKGVRGNFGKPLITWFCVVSRKDENEGKHSQEKGKRGGWGKRKPKGNTQRRP